MERISGDYIRGYTKAIQDIIEVFESVESGLKPYHKHLNEKMAMELLSCIRDNRMVLREKGTEDCFIRWNVATKEFECVDKKG